jgi:multidrug resistance efflux pump
VLALIGRSVASGGDTTPSDADRRHATRTVAPPGGVRDERVVVPADGAHLAGNGIVEPAQPETKVATQLAGKIAHVLVAEGREVAAGTPLVEMESGVERAALAAAESDVASTQATFARTSHGNRAEDVEAALAEAESAKAHADSSATTLTRTETLEKSGAATPDELDRARTAAAADRATYQALAARAKASAAGSRFEDVVEAKAKLLAAQARRDEAKAALDRLTIRAPIAGEVLRVKYRDGEYYNPAAGDALVVLGDTHLLRVRIDVDERDVARVRLGARAFATADAWPGRRFSGHVVERARRFGRKNVRTDDPVERIDTKILEVVLELEDPTR